MKNGISSWRTFAVGDEIKIAGDEEKVKWEAMKLSDRLGVSAFVKDMILQLPVKGDAVGFKRYTEDGKELEERVCVNPVPIKVKYAQSHRTEVRQSPEDHPGVGEGLDLPVRPGAPPQVGCAFVFAARQLDGASGVPVHRAAAQLSSGRKGHHQALEQVRDMVHKTDLKSGLVVPFYVTVATHGTDGLVFNVEDKLKDTAESGKVADLNTLTVKQLQTLAQQNGVSITRTKSDFIKLLDQVQPGINRPDLTGATLKAKLKDHKIGLLRTKEELVMFLARKPKALKKAQIVSEQLKKGEGLHVLTVEEPQEVTRTKGVSIYRFPDQYFGCVIGQSSRRHTK